MVNIVSTYWSKKKGSLGAVLKSVIPVDWSGQDSRERYPFAWAAIDQRMNHPMREGVRD